MKFYRRNIGAYTCGVTIKSKSSLNSIGVIKQKDRILHEFGHVIF